MSTYLSKLANWMVGKPPMSPSQLYDAGCPRSGNGRVMDIVKITDTVRAMCKHPNIKITRSVAEMTKVDPATGAVTRSTAKRPQYKVLAVGDLTPTPRQGATKQQPKEADWSKVWQRINKPS